MLKESLKAWGGRGEGERRQQCVCVSLPALLMIMNDDASVRRKAAAEREGSDPLFLLVPSPVFV